MTLGQVVGRPGFSALKFNPIYVENCLPFLVESTTREKKERSRALALWQNVAWFSEHQLFLFPLAPAIFIFLKSANTISGISVNLGTTDLTFSECRSAAKRSAPMLWINFVCSFFKIMFLSCNFPDFPAMVSQNKNSLALLEFSEASLWTPKYKFDWKYCCVTKSWPISENESLLSLYWVILSQKSVSDTFWAWFVFPNGTQFPDNTNRETKNPQKSVA